MRERVLITGGAGFLGTALAARLCDRFEVTALDNLRRNALGRTSLVTRGRVRLIQADVLDLPALSAAVAPSHHVVHLASVAGVDAVEADPVTTLRTTLGGTDHLMQACAAAPDLRRVVIASSSEVYGRDADRPAEEDACLAEDLDEPRWSYALAKLTAERLALGWGRRLGLSVCVVRPFNVYGPGQVGQGAVHTFVVRALEGLPLELHNGGGQVRAWCYVDDLVDGLELALFHPDAGGGVFNLGDPAGALSIRQLAGRIAALAGSRIPPVVRGRPGPDVDRRVPDITRARQVLGFRPRVDLETGLRRTVAWYRSAADRAKEVPVG